MKRSILALSMTTLALSATAFGQSKRDLKKINTSTSKIEKSVTSALEYLERDQASRFRCFPDYQAPFETIKANLAVAARKNLDQLMAQNSSIIEQLEPEIAKIDALKELKKSKKSKEEKQAIQKMIDDKAVEVAALAEKVREDEIANYNLNLQNLVTGDGAYNLAVKGDENQISNLFKQKVSSSADAYNKNIIEVLNQCKTKSCVYLVTADLKKWYKDLSSTDRDLKIGASRIVAENMESNRKIGKALDQLADKVSADKELGVDNMLECLDSNTDNGGAPVNEDANGDQNGEDIIDGGEIVPTAARDNTYVHPAYLPENLLPPMSINGGGTSVFGY